MSNRDTLLCRQKYISLKRTFMLKHKHIPLSTCTHKLPLIRSCTNTNTPQLFLANSNPFSSCLCYVQNRSFWGAVHAANWSEAIVQTLGALPSSRCRLLGTRDLRRFQDPVFLHRRVFKTLFYWTFPSSFRSIFNCYFVKKQLFLSLSITGYQTQNWTRVHHSISC